MTNDITSILQPFAPQHKTQGHKTQGQAPTKFALLHNPQGHNPQGQAQTHQGPRQARSASEQTAIENPAALHHDRTSLVDSPRALPPAELKPEGNAQRPSPAMANMMGAFLTTSDMKGFDVNSDLNADGVINFQDLAALRDIETGGGVEPSMNPKELLHNMTEAFFSSKGSKDFDAASDLSGDGIINFQDLAILRSKLENY